MNEQPSTTPRFSTTRRLLLLLACLALGIAIGYIGQSITAQSAWFLAVPACIAIGWLFVADPGVCLACEAPQPHDSLLNNCGSTRNSTDETKKS